MNLVRRDEFTAREYLQSAGPRGFGSGPSGELIESQSNPVNPSDSEEEPNLPPPYALALGRHYPVLLTPAKPDLSRFFLIPALDFVVGSFVKHSGVYDGAEEQVLRRLVREDDCVVEVGSNIGSYTVVSLSLEFVIVSQTQSLSTR